MHDCLILRPKDLASPQIACLGVSQGLESKLSKTMGCSLRIRAPVLQSSDDAGRMDGDRGKAPREPE